MPLDFNRFERGIVTSGGIGPPHVGAGPGADQGGAGGPGGAITIDARVVMPRGVQLWTGAGLETVQARLVTPVRGILDVAGYTGGLGGRGGGGGVNQRGGDGGAGGMAGDVRVFGLFEPAISLDDTDNIAGFAEANPNEATLTVIGDLYEYAGDIPIVGGVVSEVLLSVTAVGGSGGYPGGSIQAFPGFFGVAGDHGQIELEGVVAP